MTMYYIYHIPGVMFGCTEDLERRKTDHPADVRKLIMLHEVIVDSTPLEAGRRKKVLNIHYGYKDRTPYILDPRRKQRSIMKQAQLRQPPISAWKPRQHQPRGICPHCGFESTLAVLGRHHLDRCPESPDRR